MKTAKKTESAHVRKRLERLKRVPLKGEIIVINVKKVLTNPNWFLFVLIA